MTRSGGRLLQYAAYWLCALAIVCATATPGRAGQVPAQPQTATPGSGANNSPAAPASVQAGGAAPQTPLPTDQAPGLSITVSLTDTFINTRLPFDVPFYLSVTPGEQTTTQMSLSVYEVTRRRPTTDQIAELQDSRDCTSRSLRKRSESTARRGAGTTFSLLVNELDPQRYYVLCFVSRGRVPATEIDGDVRKIFRETASSLILAPPPNVQPPDVSQAMGDQIYGRLQQAITQLGGQRAVPAIIPPGNIFAPGTRVARGSRFALLLVPFISAYRNLDINSPAYRAFLRDRDALYTAVDAAIRSPAGSEFGQDVRDKLPARDIELPDRNLAILSNDAVDLSKYDFEDARQALERAAGAASRVANGKETSDALTNAVAALTNMGTDVGRYMLLFASLRTATQQLVDVVALDSQRVTVSLSSSVLTADMNRNAYVSLDTGIAYPWRLDSMVFYAGANIYFRPINKEAPLSYKGSFLHRFALTIGLTTTVKDDSRRASDLRTTPNDQSTTNSLLIGGGFRITPSLRVGAGALIFKESDPNPLINQTSVTATPYVGFSLDVNIGDMFKSFAPSRPE